MKYYSILKSYLQRNVWQSQTHVSEKLISGFGGFLGIFSILAVNVLLGNDPLATTWIIASMAASAVLLFAVPHGVLSQPWPLIGGHLISALIAVICHHVLPWPLVSVACSVGMAIFLMYLLGCLHPPGGATALAFSLSPQLQELGFTYVLMPVAMNVVILFMVAYLYNKLIVQRNYPVKAEPDKLDSRLMPITHADLVYAISEIDTFIDITEQDLLRIYELATRTQHPQRKI